MSLRTIVREVVRTATFWIPTSNPPVWIQKSSEVFERNFVKKHGHDHIDAVKYLRGKHRLYKIVYGTTGPRLSTEIKYYWKPRVR